ncbi:hypothetical protein EAI49_12555 [Escherichia coli]|nr:hypothetical protein CDC27_00265 [Escherichia coli]RLX95982.1 hypothetical protein EAI49_12555 [Escherichia coli]
MQCPGKEAIVPVTTGSLRLTSLNLALRGLTGQMTYLHLFNFSSLIGMNTHNHFVRHVNPLKHLADWQIIFNYDS